ncbi:hypothetical protein MBRA_03810 [Methylobacterium brachiatum]|nr:hypothetical protein MBRA_03810 [Methylobacterium brachiatum]
MQPDYVTPNRERAQDRTASVTPIPVTQLAVPNSR